jgi:hypothetical protein
MGRSQEKPNPELERPADTSERDRAEEAQARLARIRQLWHELGATEPGSLEHQALTRRIRLEAKAYNKAVGERNPKP